VTLRRGRRLWLWIQERPGAFDRILSRIEWPLQSARSAVAFCLARYVRSSSSLATYPCRTRRKRLRADVRQRLAVIGGGLREHLSAVLEDVAQSVERLDSYELPPNDVVVLVLVGGFLLMA